MSSDIVDEARQWKGTRFHHQGRKKNVGCDCVGLIIGVCKKLGLTEFDTTQYSKIPDGKMLRETCEREMLEISFSDAAPGDVVLFRFDSAPQHLAFLGDHPFGGFTIIHAYSISRCVIETRLDSVWLERLVSCYRIKR